MGFFDRFRNKSRQEGDLAREARARELAGDLGAAVEHFLRAELPDEAARVLLLRADADPVVEKRMAFCSLAGRTAVSEDLRKQARARKALLSFDVLKGRGGAFLENEVRAVAIELEDSGELERAADAYAMVGDAEAEVRVLTAAGSIDRLEERLRASEKAAREGRDLDLTLRKLGDLDRTAERRAALRLAEEALAELGDERIADAARTIRGRLLRGPVIDVELDGRPRRVALGAEVTIGRGEATLVIASRAVSRVHLKVARDPRVPGGVVVVDLDTRNGTQLAGARVSGSLPVGEGVSLRLGGEVPVSVTPAEGGVALEVAGQSYFAPLGPFTIPGTEWILSHEPLPERSGEGFVVLVTPEGKGRPYLGEFQLAGRVELSHKDEIRSSRGGAIRLRVPASRGGLDDDTEEPPGALS